MEILNRQPSDFSLLDFDLLFEYLLLINPEGEVFKSTYDGKKQFSLNYWGHKNKVTPPHITLANFFQPDLFESQIITGLEKVAQNSNQLRVVLKDYGWFDNVLYYNIEHKTDIQQLVRKIKNAVNRFMITEKKATEFKQKLAPRFILSPHITVGKDLTPEQFQKSKIEYASIKFEAEFVAKEIVLLKRFNTDPYQEIGRFKLNGPDMLTVIKQGNLFQ